MSLADPHATQTSLAERFKQANDCTCTWTETFEGEAGASLELAERDRRCRAHGKPRWDEDATDFCHVHHIREPGLHHCRECGHALDNPDRHDCPACLHEL